MKCCHWNYCWLIVGKYVFTNGCHSSCFLPRVDVRAEVYTTWIWGRELWFCGGGSGRLFLRLDWVGPVPICWIRCLKMWFGEWEPLNLRSTPRTSNTCILPQASFRPQHLATISTLDGVPKIIQGGGGSHGQQLISINHDLIFLLAKGHYT